MLCGTGEKGFTVRGYHEIVTVNYGFENTDCASLVPHLLPARLLGFTADGLREQQSIGTSFYAYTPMVRAVSSGTCSA